MRVRRWLIGIGAAAAALGLWLGSWWLRQPSPTPSNDAPQPLWVLRDAGGQLAQYDYRDQTAPLRTWQVYTALLPAQDRQKLADGIPVYSDAQLRQLVEDLGG